MHLAFKFCVRRSLGPDLGFKFGPRRAWAGSGFQVWPKKKTLWPDLGFKFGPRRALGPDLGFKFGPRRGVGRDLGFKFCTRRALGPDLGFKLAPRSSWGGSGFQVGTDSGSVDRMRRLVAQVKQRIM